jgi:hypothetical protein
MSVGTGARLLSNLPAQPYVIDPGLFFQLTSGAKNTPITKAYPGPGQSLSIELPHVGVLAEIRIIFEGTVANASTGVEDALWAYRLVQDVRFSGSGQTDLISCRGIDLHALRFARHAALNRGTEFYATTPDENGNFRAVWQIPVATDMTSLVGAVWAQSQATQLTLDIRTSSYASIGLTGGTVAVTGNFKVNLTWFDPPYHPDGSGRIVIPDLTKTHGIITRDQPIAGTGTTPTELAQQAATLMRMFAYTDLGSASGVAAPVDYTIAAPVVTRHEFEYGAIQTPYEWNPAWLLACENSEAYGAPLPKGHVCLDLVKQNPLRDTIMLNGITDPRWKTEIAAGTALAAGAHVHLVQELLYV